MPSTLSILTNVFPRDERGKAIGIWAGVSGLGVGLGPLAGGLLLEHFWWGSVFFINIPIIIVALVAGVLLVPESRDPHPVRLDSPGAVLSISAVTILVFSIIEAPARGWTDDLVLAGFGVGRSWSRCSSTGRSGPTTRCSTWRSSATRDSQRARGLSRSGFFALFGMVFGMTQYLQFVQGYTPLEAGLRMVPVALGMAARRSQPPAGLEVGYQQGGGPGPRGAGRGADLDHFLGPAHRILGHRPDLLLHGLRYGQRDGSVHRRRDGRRTGGERRRGLGDERRDPAGGGASAWR